MALAARAASPRPEPRIRGARLPWQRVAALLALTAISVGPVLVAWLRTPGGHVFTGYVVIARDAFVYQALWRAGWAGAFTFHPLYSSEPEPGILIYAWYLFTGHLVGFFAGALLYHLTRLLATLALLLAVWALVCALYRPRLLRRAAMIFACLGGGIGILLGTGAHLGPFGLRPTEILVAGTGVTDLSAMAPHLPLAAALLCAIFTASIHATRGGSVRVLLAAVVAQVGLALIYPQLSLVAIVAIGGWALVTRQGTGLAFAALIGAAAAPYLAYLAWMHTQAPAAFAAIGSNEQVPVHFDVGDPFGFLVLSHLAASGLIIVALVARRIRGDLLLPAAWVVVVTAFMFVPGLQTVVGRSFQASSIPFGILAAAGLPPLIHRVHKGAWRRRAVLLTLAASSLFGVYSLAQPYAIAAFRLDANAEYERTGEASLLQWLAPRSSARDLVLTTYLDGVFVPAESNARAYVGHPDQTLDVREKARWSLAFFTQWDRTRRDAFLDANGINYVLARSDDVARLSGDSMLSAVKSADGDVLYQVSP